MKSRIIVVGGFLGAGKTTLLLRATQELIDRGYRVGLVTNDQGEDLVDTALGRDAAVPVAEVAGGCFCCRFPDLLTSLQHLQDVAKPDVILTEPVGSCTDLVATVLRPLVQFYGEQYELAPLTVLRDSTRSMDGFPENIRYLYQQQLAEAELILLNKSDLLTSEMNSRQQDECHTTFPQARAIPISARTGDGIASWLDIVLGQASANPDALQIDYQRYAEAEAALGWLNAKGQIRAHDAYCIRQWTSDLLTNLGALCDGQHASIAHIKTLVTTPQSTIKASITQSASQITWDVERDLVESTGHEFILNVRVNATPEQLERMTMQAIEASKPAPNSRYYIEHFECFSPLPPQPYLHL